MSSSENQAAEASEDTNVMRIGPPGNRIRIRLPPRKRLSGGPRGNIIRISLPPRKRLSDGLNTLSLGATEDGNSRPGIGVSEQSNNNTESTNFITETVKVEESNSDTPRLDLLGKTLSNHALPEEVNFIIPSKNPTTTTRVQDKEKSSCLARIRLCEEGNKNMLSKGLPPENSSNIQHKVGAIDLTPSKNLAVAKVHAEVEKNNCSTCSDEDARTDVVSKRLIYDTNISTVSKGVAEDAKINNQSKNLTISAVKCEEGNDNITKNSILEETRCNVPMKLSADARNNAQSRRPADLTNDKISNKKLCTPTVQVIDTSQKTLGMKLFTSVGQAGEQSTNSANFEATKQYKEFEEKVRRTVYLDNLSPQVTGAVIKMALNQFGSVRNVTSLVNYTVPYDIPQSALVEMETEKDAVSVVNVLQEFPFMMAGMPRPVRAKHATSEMFNDRPQRPGSKLEFHWIGPKDPGYEDFRKFRLISKKHELENLALIKLEMEQEELLAKQQQENLDCNYRKLATLDTAILNGCINHLSRAYNVRLHGDYNVRLDEMF
ncbi:hypothetical protein ACP4OV_006999 [Aristida adscensionis]